MQYPLIKDLGVPTEHLLYATDFPYTVRKDSTGCFQAGYDEPKKSGLFDDAAMEDIVRNNALKVFPRISEEFKKLEAASERRRFAREVQDRGRRFPESLS